MSIFGKMKDTTMPAGSLGGTDRRAGGMLFAALSLPLLDRGQGAVDRQRALVEAESARRDNVEWVIRRDVKRAYEVARTRIEGGSRTSAKQPNPELDT
jgi:outer membrane protein TolC